MSTADHLGGLYKNIHPSKQYGASKSFLKFCSSVARQQQNGLSLLVILEFLLGFAPIDIVPFLSPFICKY